MRTTIVSLAAAIALASCGADERYVKETAAFEEDQVECQPEGLEVIEIDTLITAYEENEARAQLDYGGRCLLVRGVVEEVDLDWLDEPVVRLNAAISTRPRVRFSEDYQEEAAALAKGAEAQFICAELSEFLGSPGLSQCRIVAPMGS